MVLLCLLAAVAQVHASPTPAPGPVITPPAILPRDNTKTLGWYASASSGSLTYYSPWWYDADTSTFSSSGSFLRRCAVSSACTMFTSCSSGWMVGPSGSSFCGISTMTDSASRAYYCSSHIWLPSMGATSGAQKWFWCDAPPLTGYTIYQKQPAGATAITTSSSPTSQPSGASTTGRSASKTSSATRSSSASSSPTPVSPTPSSGTPIAAIVGGVVGGIAILGALAFAIFFIMRRDKKKKLIAATHYQNTPLMAGATAYQPSSGYAPQGEFYGAGNETKPLGMANTYSQSYPMGPYDPHLGPQYPAGAYPGPQELSAPVHFAPQELPAHPVSK